MSTGFTFGALTSAPPAFGSTSLTFGGAANQSTGLSFGATTAMQGTTPSLFGTPATAPTSTASLFGTPAATTAALTLSFGSTTNPPAFGAVPASSTSTSFGFGAPASTAGTTGFGLGGAQTTTSLAGPGLGASLTASTIAPSFGFGLTATTSAAPLTTSTGNLSFGFGGLAPPTSSSLAPSTTSASVGLGGIASSSQSRSSTVQTQKEIPPKEQPLPNEILQTVEAFKDMVKQQKLHSSDIARCSIRDFRRVEQEIDQLNNQLSDIENQLQKNRQLAEKLKYDTAKTVQNVEMAQRTHDTPPGLQYENTAPLRFFLNLAEQFEKDMQNLKLQIEAVDKYVKNHKNPDSLTPQDLSMGMRRLHETFVALAGRLHAVHSQVESQKEIYLNIRKHLLQDASNPFDKLVKMPEFFVQNAFVHSPPKVATGPTPFNNLALRSMNTTTGVNSQQNTITPPPPAYPGTSSAGTGNSLGFGSSGFSTSLGGTQPSNTSLFGSSSFGQPLTFGQTSFNNSFQLQKPPTGNKRGKI